MNQKMIDDMSYWVGRIRPCECSGIRLTAEECHRLGLILECAYESILHLITELDIERSRNNALDPEGSRRRMELQRQNGATPYEARTRGARGWRTETEDETGKSVFRNI